MRLVLIYQWQDIYISSEVCAEFKECLFSIALYHFATVGMHMVSIRVVTVSIYNCLDNTLRAVTVRWWESQEVIVRMGDYSPVLYSKGDYSNGD